jgi:CheY-like chemotaxis protein
MTADDINYHRAARAAPADLVPDLSRRAATAAPADRILRQVTAIDAWIAARRKLEHAWRPPRVNGDDRMDVDPQLEVLRRTHDVIRGRCARELEGDVGPMRSPGLTAVVAHRDTWFVDKVALLLEDRGVTVLACTDNGAEALGVVVAEQPDVLLLSARLAMMPGRLLLTETHLFAPGTLRAVQASDQQQEDQLRATSEAVFLRHHPPSVVADALVALHLRRNSS